MYTAIFCDKKNEVIHLWDDTKPKLEMPLRVANYAYRRKAGGEYKSLYGDDLEKIYNFDERDTDLFESDVPLETKILLNVSIRLLR